MLVLALRCTCLLTHRATARACALSGLVLRHACLHGGHALHALPLHALHSTVLLALRVRFTARAVTRASAFTRRCTGRSRKCKAHRREDTHSDLLCSFHDPLHVWLSASPGGPASLAGCAVRCSD
jgi:hypothetical protein